MTADSPLAQPVHRARRERWADAAWLGALVVWAVVYCIPAAARIGVTYDEPFYLYAGLDGWYSGSPQRTTTVGTMPLPVFAATLPVYLEQVRTGERVYLPFERLRVARAVTLVWFVLLLVLALRLGRAAGGPWAGRLAAGLIAADPNFLAHAALATTDIATAAALVGLTCATYTGRAGGGWRRVALPGVWYGLAILCKLSALLYGGIILLALEIAHRFTSGTFVRPAGASARDWSRTVAGAILRSVLAVGGAVALGIAVAIVGCGVPGPDTNPLARMAGYVPATDPLRPKLDELAVEYPRLPYAVVALVAQTGLNLRERPAFLNGTAYPGGCWFYYPVLMAMKVPAPALLLGLGALVRPRAALNALALVGLLLTAATLAASVQIGVRLVLPVVAIGYVWVAVAIVRGFGRSGAMVGAVAVALVAATAVWVWPHGLGYLNQFVGGPSAAPDRVTDSNLDWGQGLPDLRAWHRANGAPPIALWYFGTDPDALRAPFVPVAPDEERIETEADLRRVVGSRVLAVSVSMLTVAPDETPSKATALALLRGRRPLARTPTFVIYDFRDPPR
ncbi:MAG TPA: glycosyltransferase family 39 protein [Gemmata sp.]